MRETITFDPKGKKSEYQQRAKEAGMKLGPWIEMMCDRGDDSELFEKFGLMKFVPGPDTTSSVSGFGPDKPASKITMSPGRPEHSANCTCLSCRGK